MNRRHFLQSSATASIALVAAPSLLVGCTSSELEGYLNAALQSAESILGLSSANDPWYADLQAAIAALKATESTWTGATVTAAIESALNALDAVLAVIPFTAAYSPLIDLLTTAIETILNLFVKPTPSVAAKATHNPHAGRVPLKAKGFLQSPAKAYRQQWNDAVVGLQLPASAKI